MWRDAKVIGNYAYIVSEAQDHGMQVKDYNRCTLLKGLLANMSFNQLLMVLFDTFPLILLLKIFDLTQLRSGDGFQVVEATAIHNEFGQCFNVVANPQTNFVYAVGATWGNYSNICGGAILN